MDSQEHQAPDRVGSGGSVERALRAALVLHPVPSSINTVLVASLALVAGAGPAVAVVLASAMFGFQVSIGSLNDLVDSGDDRSTKPRKPIPAGLVSTRAAAAIVVVGGVTGLAISATFGLVVLALGAAGYASGLAYDLFMRRWGLGWLCFSLAFPALLAWTWIAATGMLPSGSVFLLALAALAGPAVHLANSLVDLEDDERTGRRSLATRLGVQRARLVLAILTGTLYVLAWAALSTLAPVPFAAIVGAAVASIGAALGVAASWQASRRSREAGWLLQAAALATMAVALLAAIASTG